MICPSSSPVRLASRPARRLPDAVRKMDWKGRGTWPLPLVTIDGETARIR